MTIVITEVYEAFKNAGVDHDIAMSAAKALEQHREQQANIDSIRLQTELKINRFFMIVNTILLFMLLWTLTA